MMLNRLALSLSCAALLATAAQAQSQDQAQTAQPQTTQPQAAAPSAPAQTSSATEVAPITVQGIATPKVIERQTSAFVQSYAVVANPELDQIVRWRDPVCIKATGLIDRQDEAIETRITDVAKAVDLRIGKRGCKANIEIVFTDQPQAFMDSIYKRREYMLGYYHRHEGVRLKKMTLPIQAWHVTATLGDHGNGGNFSEVIDDPENMPPQTCGISHVFTSCLQGVFKNILVVVDNSTLGDKDLGLVTDYLAMVALAEPQSLKGCNDLPSVIDVFAKAACPDRDTPNGLTPADAAYLTALYSADPEAKKWSESGDIANRMSKILIRASALAHK
jgi:hypothetical protein